MEGLSEREKEIKNKVLCHISDLISSSRVSSVVPLEGQRVDLPFKLVHDVEDEPVVDSTTHHPTKQGQPPLIIH